MTYRVLLSLLLVFGCVHVHSAPVEQAGLEQGSCEDPSAKGAAGLALTRINQDRQDGYIFSLHRLSNVHVTKHGETGVVFYLTLDVVETNCSVLSRKDWKTCEARPDHDTPVYGQCKAAIYINKPHRVVRLYKYNCAVRPAPAAKISETCPDCPSHVALDNPEVQKTVSLSLEKFNKESGLANRFALLKVNRATAGMAMSMYYNAEYTIQETTCPKSTVTTENCPLMDCEFSHKGFCKASHFHNPTGEETSVECEIYEPEAAEREKKLHLLGGETDHSHSAHTHDHNHDHAHGHSHDHGHGHDHVHAHHAKAHDHSGDSPNHHHNYKHADGEHTHEHDHELALDHNHRHAHLHEHEHHHHHHEHTHEIQAHDNPEGVVTMLPALGQPVTLPSFPDVPAAGPEVGVTLPLKPDPQIPGHTEPAIRAFPTSLSAQCPPAAARNTLVETLFSEDPVFKPAA